MRGCIGTESLTTAPNNRPVPISDLMFLMVPFHTCNHIYPTYIQLQQELVVKIDASHLWIRFQELAARQDQQSCIKFGLSVCLL